MLTYKYPTEKDYVEFLRLIHADAGHYIEHAMELMHMDWARFEELLKTVGEVRGIYEDDRLAGFYWIERRRDELHVHGLIIENGFQGRGIGTEVLRLLEDRYAGIVRVMELAVHDSNPRAKQLYERLGFRTVRPLEDEGFDIMQKPVGSGDPG